MKRKTKNDFPSKEDIINTILIEDPTPEKFEKLMLIIEHKKISNKLGIIKAELLQNKKVVVKGSLTCIPQKFEETFNWDMLKIGQSYFNGLSLDYKGETVGSIIKEGIKKSFKEGKIPFIQK